MEDEQDDCFDQHAPEGFPVCCLQCWQGETQEEAIQEAVDIFGGTGADFRVRPGHFQCPLCEREETHSTELDECVWEFVGHGWMVFQKPPPKR